MLEPTGQLGFRGGGTRDETGCLMLGQRASEVNFHLENSKGLRGLGVEWEGWRQRRVASGQGSGMSGNPQSPPAEDTGIARGAFSSLPPLCTLLPSPETSPSPWPLTGTAPPPAARLLGLEVPPGLCSGYGHLRASRPSPPCYGPASTAQARLGGLGLTPPSSPRQQAHRFLLPKRPPPHALPPTHHPSAPRLISCGPHGSQDLRDSPA